MSAKPAVLAVIVNGERANTISALDRGFLYGHGVFETIAVRHGALLFVKQHAERLSAGLKALHINIENITAIFDELHSWAQDYPYSNVRVTVSSGVGLGYASDENNISNVTFIFTSHDRSIDVAKRKDGIIAGDLTTPLSESVNCIGLKHCNRIDQVLAANEAAKRGWQEGVVYSQAGVAVEGIMSNVFIVQGKDVKTPALYSAGVQGVMRDKFLETYTDIGKHCQVVDLTKKDINAANEIFFTNSVRGIVPAKTFNGKAKQIEFTRELQSLFLNEFPLN